MFFAPKKPDKSGKKNSRHASPLDRRQQALREAEEKLRKQKEQLERLLQEAPRLREEQTRRRREQFASDPRLSRTALVDKHIYRAEMVANPAFGQRRLRSEKRDGLYLFLFLIAVLASVLFWICRLVL